MADFNPDESFEKIILSQSDILEIIDEVPEFSFEDNFNGDIFDIKLEIGPIATDELEENKENYKRFPILLAEDLDFIAGKCSEKSTGYQTKWAVKLFSGEYVFI